MSAPKKCDECGAEVWGIEIRGVYDGVLFWACDSCGKTWERWTGEDFRAERAREHERQWRLNRGRTE